MIAPDATDVISLEDLGIPALQFAVVGVPGPQGSKTGIIVKGKVVMKESSAAVKPWRQAVAHAALLAVDDGWEPLDGPLVADMIFTMPKPANAPKRLRRFPTAAPDISKLVRSTEDALDTDANVIANDSRIVAYRRLAEFYTGDPDPDALRHPGAIIRFWRHPHHDQSLVLAGRDAMPALP